MAHQTEREKIEQLFVGTGAQALAAIKARSDVFCPFEAIGMVHQEIRHSNFLAYCLDPVKPHGFGDRLLREFLFMVCAVAPEKFPDKLDLSLRSLDQVEVLREWHHIDLLIRVPSETPDTPELVVAVEQKIHAGEGEGQLERYRTLLCARFPMRGVV